LNREEALQAVKSNVKNENLIKHMLAVEAIMRKLAVKFGEDEEEWGLAGLLHDIDVEICDNDMSLHSKKGAEMLREMGLSEAIVHAVLTHNTAHGVACESLMDKSLFCGDPLTGLITAAVLVRAKSVRKRFKEKSFAAGANREQIALCSEIGMELGDFITLGVEAMQGIADDLGLA